VSSDNPNKLEPPPWTGTISELVEKLAESIESWSDLDKAILRAGVTGKLGPTTKKIQ
jgi:hypothetical protein